MSEEFPYELIRVLGRGAMGTVYSARHVPLDRIVALKLLDPKRGDLEAATHRMGREGKALARLTHANLIKIFDTGMSEGRPFIAMELIVGQTLSAWVETDPIEVRRRADLLLGQIVGAVAVLHEAGFVHRDLKPENVMITADHNAIVMDLGLVRAMNESTLLTQTGSAVGTPAYMSPEALRGGTPDPAVDVWALGCLYFYMVAGHGLFRASSLDEMFSLVVDGPTPDLLVDCPDLPDDRRTLLDAMLSRDIARRPATAMELVTQIQLRAPRSRRGAARPQSKRGVTESVSSGATGEAAGRPHRRMALTGALGIGLALLVHRSITPTRSVGALTSRHGPVESSEPSSRTTLPDGRRPSTTPSPIGLLPAPSPAPLSWRWRQLLPHEKMLRAQARLSKDQTNQLAQVAGLPLGNDPARWLTWIELGRWLDTMPRAPLPGSLRSARNPGGPDSEVLFGVEFNQLASRTVTDVYCYQLALDMIHQTPDLAFGWMLLGRAMQAEASPDAGRIQAIMSRGLACRWPVAWGLDKYLGWELLVSALETQGSGALEGGWWLRVPNDFVHPWPVHVLTIALEDEPDRLTNLLNKVPAGHNLRSHALRWGGVTHQVVGHTTRAIECWSQALEASPDPMDGARFLEFALYAGDVEVARALRPRVVLTPDQVAQYSSAVGDWRAYRMALSRLDPTSELVEIAIFLERGDTVEALAAMRVVSRKPGVDADKLIRLAIWARSVGGPLPWLDELISTTLNSTISPAKIALWDQAAGAFAMPATHGLMEQLLGRLARTKSGTAAAVRAVWLSRQGRHKEAFETLQSAEPSELASFLDLFELEVRTRPFWDQRLGKTIEPGLLDRIRLYEGRLSRSDRASYRRHMQDVVDGDLTRAKWFASRLLQSSLGAYWPSVRTWCHRLAPPGQDPAWDETKALVALRVRQSIWARRTFELQPPSRR